MSADEILVLGSRDIEEPLADREEEILAVVARAYVAPGEGRSSLPHLTFLRFPR